MGKYNCIFCGKRARPWCDENAKLLECNSCGAVYKNPMPTIDQLNDMYDEYYSNENILGAKTQMLSSNASVDNHAEYIATLLEKGGRILDYGAGTGCLVNKLLSFGYKVDGVEFSYLAIREAEKLYNLKLYPALDKLKNASVKYDLIICVEVIEHMTDPGEMLRLLNTFLKPGGMIYITTPNRKGLQARIKKCKWREALKPFHLVLFDYTYLRNLLHLNGYIFVKYIRFSPLTNGNMVKIILHRLMQLFGLYGGLRVVAIKK